MRDSVVKHGERVGRVRFCMHVSPAHKTAQGAQQNYLHFVEYTIRQGIVVGCPGGESSDRDTEQDIAYVTRYQENKSLALYTLYHVVIKV